MRKVGEYVHQTDPPSDWMVLIQVMLIKVPEGRGGRILCTGAPPSLPPHVSKCVAFIQSRPHMFKVRPPRQLTIGIPVIDIRALWHSIWINVSLQPHLCLLLLVAV